MPHRAKGRTITTLVKELRRVDTEIEAAQSKLEHLRMVKVPLIVQLLRMVPTDRMEPTGSGFQLPLNPFIDPAPRAAGTIIYVRHANDTDGFLGDTRLGGLAIYEQEQLLLGFNRIKFLEFYNSRKKPRR